MPGKNHEPPLFFRLGRHPPWRSSAGSGAVLGVALEEDVSCAELFKLGDKDVLLCISHHLGCRYYLGEWKNEQFYPDFHAQMSWVDNEFFAPESLQDDKGRRIMWAWLMSYTEFGKRWDKGWSGTMSLPRVLSLDENGQLLMDVPEEIEVDPILTPNLILKPGKQTLSGEVALAYARARHTEGGDFDRSKRQQQVALAIRSQILRLNMIPTLVAKAPALYQELASGIHTNLSIEQMISLGLMVFQINPGNIGRAVISPPEMVTLERVIYGGEVAEVLKPVPDKIRMLRDEIFTATGAIGPSVDTGDPQSAAEDEFARLAVLNGAGEEGLAGRFADALREMGFNVTEIANADRMDYPTTRIVDYTGNPYTTQYLVTLLDLTQSQVLFQTLPEGEVDVALVIGYDWQALLAKLSSD